MDPSKNKFNYFLQVLIVAVGRYFRPIARLENISRKKELKIHYRVSGVRRVIIVRLPDWLLRFHAEMDLFVRLGPKNSDKLKGNVRKEATVEEERKRNYALLGLIKILKLRHRDITVRVCHFTHF